MNPASPISPSRRGSGFLDPGSKPTNLDIQPYDPNDGYDYNNVGDPPEGSDTKFEVVLTASEQQDIPLPSLAPKMDLLELPGTNKVKAPPASPAAQEFEATSQELEEHVPGLEGPKHRIGRRPVMQWRAKVPSDLEQGNPAQEQVENGQLSGNHANVPSNATGSRYNLLKRSTTRGKSDAGPQENKDEHLRVETHEIKLHWKKIPTDEETKFELNITSSVPGDGVAEDHLKWHHREDLIMNLNKLKDIVSQRRSTGLPNEEIGLTERLLRRVKADEERSFRGGYFLQPHANRYDGTHVLKDKPDVACIFFNFPYFSFSKALPKPNVKGEHHEHLEKEDMDPRKDHEHPVRTLLQSRYRLNKTTVRDQIQAPRSLERKALTSFISPLPEYWDCTSTKLVDEILYVPQMWGMILGTNTIITSGPLTSRGLQGPVLKLSPSDHRLSLVQISFGDETFNYPVQQCLSWFGLANKQRRIVNKLGIEKSKANPRDYRFYRDSTTITINNWSQILRESKDIETLRIEMRRIAPGINVTQHADDTIPLQTIPDAKNVPPDPVGLPPVDSLPGFSPFLEWPVLDQFGEPYKEDESQKGQRVRRFLAHVKRSLISTEFDQDSGRPQTSTRQPSATTSTLIDRKTFTQVGETLADLRKSQTIPHFPKRELLFDQFKRLLNMFVREEFYFESDVISLYWGCVLVILKELESDESQVPNLSELTIAVSNLVAHAEELHRGVHHFQPVDVPDQSGNNRDSVTDDGVLLEVMIDALISVFKMVIAAARYVKRPKKQDSTSIVGPNSNVREWHQEAEAKLKDAKDQLIVESEVQSRTESVGSVVTPETTMILFLKRLASGVYGDSCIDIVGVYEECFQQLVHEVEYSASRRLLKRINGFQEEIDIINDVLKQQQKVLSDYRYMLDPASFKTASGHRKMRFAYEKKNIDKFIETLRERSSYCTELKKRARELAVQNVQLVETLQDDSSKAILMFTIVAVIFLPLSFVSGYFGMNFPDLTGTKKHSSHFWTIAAPLTSGILILCVIISVKGEQIFFAIAGSLRWMKTVALVGRKEKGA